MEYRLDKMSPDDEGAVVDIFNYFVENSFAAYPEEKVGHEFFQRFVAMVGDYPAIAVKTDTGDVIGFAFMRPYHRAKTLSRVAEVTYFILPEHTGHGLGSRVLEYFIEQAKLRGVDNFLASISSLNDQSLQFHLRHGFVECGRFRDVGVKKGKSFDVVWMQRRL
ncbi:MAG: N-acetyltransferase family protein [Candidatus Zixiibacteriota bacterium]